MDSLPHTPRFHGGEPLSASKLNQLRDAIPMIDVRFPSARKQTIHPYKVMRFRRPSDPDLQSDTDGRTITVHAGKVNAVSCRFTDEAVAETAYPSGSLMGPYSMVLPDNVTDYSIFAAAFVTDSGGWNRAGQGVDPCFGDKYTILPYMHTPFIAHGEDLEVTLRGWQGPYKAATIGGVETKDEYDIQPGTFATIGGTWQEIPTRDQIDFTTFTYTDGIHPDGCELDVIPRFERFSQYDDLGPSPYASYGIGNGYARKEIAKVTVVDGHITKITQIVKENLTLAFFGKRTVEYTSAWPPPIISTRSHTMLLKSPQMFAPDNWLSGSGSRDSYCRQNLFETDDLWCNEPSVNPCPLHFVVNGFCCQIYRWTDGDCQWKPENTCVIPQTEEATFYYLLSLGYPDNDETRARAAEINAQCAEDMGHGVEIWDPTLAKYVPNPCVGYYDSSGSIVPYDTCGS